MHRKQIRRWHKLLSASASLIAILGGVFIAPASANSAPSVDMFWADVSRTNQSTATFYLMTNSAIKNLEASDFYVFGTATGCTVDDDFAQASFYVVTVRGCSDGTVAVQLGANTVSDLSMNWGPSQGVASDFTTIDRIAPKINFEPMPASVADGSLVITATADETAALINTTQHPNLSGEGCFFAGTTFANQKFTFAIAGCQPAAEVSVTILANSFADATGNTGPSQDLVSAVVKVAEVATAVLPLPTASPGATTSPNPTSSPNPTLTPFPEPTASAPIVVPLPIDPPQPPAPAPPELSPEAEAVVPMAPIASIRAIESVVSYEPAAPSKPRRPITIAIQPETLTNPVPAPKTEFVARANAPTANPSWVMPVAAVVAAVFGAVAGALIVRSRLSRKQRLRVA